MSFTSSITLCDTEGKQYVKYFDVFFDTNTLQLSLQASTQLIVCHAHTGAAQYIMTFTDKVTTSYNTLSRALELRTALYQLSCSPDSFRASRWGHLVCETAGTTVHMVDKTHGNTILAMIWTDSLIVDVVVIVFCSVTCYTSSKMTQTSL